jgi:hypothetical protein
MGFGHRVYKNYDPRATIIKQVADQVFEVTGRNPLLDLALELERIALADDYFIRHRLYPNVDFYSGIIYQLDLHARVTEESSNGVRWQVAIGITPVISFDVEPPDRTTGQPGRTGQRLVEQELPGSGLQRGGVGDHALKAEDHGVIRRLQHLAGVTRPHHNFSESQSRRCGKPTRGQVAR